MLQRLNHKQTTHSPLFPLQHRHRMQYLQAGGSLPIEDFSGPSTSGQSAETTTSAPPHSPGMPASQGLRGVMVVARATVDNAQLIATQLRSVRARCVCLCPQLGAGGRRSWCATVDTAQLVASQLRSAHANCMCPCSQRVVASVDHCKCWAKFATFSHILGNTYRVLACP